MTSLEAYKIFLLKFDALNTEDAVDISPGEFCLIYNGEQTKFVKREYQNRSTRFIDDIQSLISTNIPLKNLADKEDYYEADLPENYLDYITSITIASTETCKRKRLMNFEVKMADLNTNLSDEFSKPSFEFEETIITLADNKIQVYTDNFNVDDVLLTYYRIPAQIDIEGYIKLDGSESENNSPELRDDLVHEILDLCVLEASRNYNEQLKAQLSQIKAEEDRKL